MTLSEYMQILDNYTFADNTIERVIAKCNKSYDFDNTSSTDISDLEQKELDLNEAWMWISATSIVGGGGETKKIGDRSLKKATIAFYASDRKRWIQNANDIFELYELPLIEDVDYPKIVDASGMWGSYDV